MGGCFDDRVSNSCCKHSLKILLDFECFECALACRIFPFLTRDSKVGGSHEAGLYFGCFENRADEIAGCGFTISASDANSTELIGRILVKGACEIGQCYAYVLHLNIKQRQRSLCVSWQCFAKSNYGPSLCRVGQKSPTIGMESWNSNK